MKQLFGFGLLLLSAPALSLTITTFNSGDTISSSQVNGNFSTIKSAVENIQANYVAYPTTTGAAGDHLVNNGAGGMSWQSPVVGSAPTFGYTTIGTSAGLSFTGGATVLNIPLAHDVGVTGGLVTSTEFQSFVDKQDALNVSAPLQKIGNTLSIVNASSSSSGVLSPADWNIFSQKMDAPTSGVQYGAMMIFNGTNWQAQAGQDQVGTQSPYPFSIVTSGLPRMKFDINGSVVIGETTPTAKLSIHHNGPTPTGKMFEIQKDGASILAVNEKGYFSSSGFMGKLQSDLPITCPYPSPTLAQHMPLPPLTLDFGSFSGSFAVPEEGVYEILVDLPFTVVGGSPYNSSVLLVKDGTYTIKLQPGRNIKRLFFGNYTFSLGCSGMSGLDEIRYEAASSVIGIRKLN